MGVREPVGEWDKRCEGSLSPAGNNRALVSRPPDLYRPPTKGPWRETCDKYYPYSRHF